MDDNSFASLFQQHLAVSGVSLGTLSNRLRLPIGDIQGWLVGHTLPADGWDIETIGKVLQLTAPETDILLMAAGFEQVFGSQPKQKPNPHTTQYDMSGDFRGAILNIGSDLSQVTQRTGQPAGDPSYWKPPVLKIPFGRQREQWQLLDTYEAVRTSGRGQVVLIVGKPSTGRHALIEWFTKQEPVDDTPVHFINPGSESKQFNSLAIQSARKNKQSPTLFILENLERGAHWIDDLLRLTQTIVEGEEHLPILMVISITAYLPLAEMRGEQHTEPTRFAQKLLQNKWATLIELGRIDETDILNSIAPANPLLAERLYELTKGSPYWCEVIWEEWKTANDMGVKQDKNGVWQAVKDEAGNLTVYASVAEQVRDQLEHLMFGQEDMEPPYSLEEAAMILQCAATEGERFTLEAVAAVLDLDKEELLDFFADFLEVDEETPENDDLGMVAWGTVKVDAVDPLLEYHGRQLIEYRFASSYLYYAWRKHPPLEKKRGAWKALLGVELERLYWPYGEKIVEKLELLNPKLAVPYRQRQGKQATLEQLRYQVYMLQRDNPDDQYIAYRLFDVGTKLLGRLGQDPATSGEGIALGEDLYNHALRWQDVEFEARIAYLWGWHFQNAGRYGEALPLNNKAVELCEENNLDQHLYAASLNNLGTLLQDMGDLAGARPYYERALTIKEKALGPDHPDTALSLNNLGYLLQAMGNLAEARPYYERALAIKEAKLGTNHPSTKITRDNLAWLNRQAGTGGQSVDDLLAKLKQMLSNSSE